jgi:GxxExxY protein
MIMHENRISGQIVEAAYSVHSALGPGLLESVYEETLSYELETRNLKFTTQVPISISYKSLQIDYAFRADMIVENKVIVELKAIESVMPMHKKQLLTYLKLSGCHLGLLINFNTVLIKNGITRLVNGL